MKPKFFRIAYPLIAFLFFWTYAVADPTVSVSFQNGLLDISARNIPLAVLLDEICRQTGLRIMAGDSLGESVTWNLKHNDIETVIQKLLKDKNYAIIFKKKENSIVVDTIKILGSKTPVLLKGSPSKPLHPQKSSPAMKAVENLFQKQWFFKEVKDTKTLTRHIQARFEPGVREDAGITVSRVSKGSIFDAIGIEKNDTILDVNGAPVRSTQDFIDLIQANAAKEVIRIERYDESGVTESL